MTNKQYFDVCAAHNFLPFIREKLTFFEFTSKKVGVPLAKGEELLKTSILNQLLPNAVRQKFDAKMQQESEF